jgi:hypothetical protein
MCQLIPDYYLPGWQLGMPVAPVPLTLHFNDDLQLFVAQHPTEGPMYLTGKQHRKLTLFVEGQHSVRSPASLLVQGPVKASKSALLATTLPGMLLAHASSQNAVFLNVNAESQPPLQFLRSVLMCAETLAIAHGMPGSALSKPPWNSLLLEDLATNLPKAIGDLTRHLAGQGRELVLLVDEIQAPLVCGTGRGFHNHEEAAVIACIKQIVLKCRTAFSGSGMVTATLHMSLSRTNGHRLLGITKEVLMGEPLPVPAKLPAMVTAVAQAAGYLPLQAGLTVDQVIADMKKAPEFAGIGLNQPLRLAVVVAALDEIHNSPENSCTLEERLRVFAVSKLLAEASVDLATALRYCDAAVVTSRAPDGTAVDASRAHNDAAAGIARALDDPARSLALFASLAHKKCTWSELKACNTSFSRIIQQLCVPCTADEDMAVLMAPYDMIAEALITADGKVLKISDRTFEDLTRAQLVYFSDIMSKPGIANKPAAMTAMSRAVLDVLQAHRVAFIDARGGSRLPTSACEFAAIPLVACLVNAGMLTSAPSPWAATLVKHAASPGSSAATLYFSTAGFELMRALRHWMVHDMHTRLSIAEVHQHLQISAQVVVDLVQKGLCKQLQKCEPAFFKREFQVGTNGFVYKK